MNDVVVPVLTICECVEERMQQYRDSIDDVFYDYKDDSDLDFLLLMDDIPDAESLTANINKLDYVVAGIRPSLHLAGNMGRTVIITMHNLAMKNAFIQVLDNNDWCANGS